MDAISWIKTQLATHLGQQVEKSSRAVNFEDVSKILSLLQAKIAKQDEFEIFTDDTFTKFKNSSVLFANGLQALQILNQVEIILHTKDVPETISPKEIVRLLSTIKVLKTLIFTANVTAPSDLWLLRLVLSSYARLGFLTDLGSGKFSIVEFSSKQNLKLKLFEADCQFLVSRGILEIKEQKLFWSKAPQIQHLITGLQPFPESWPRNFVPLMQNVFEERVLKATEEEILISWLDAHLKVDEKQTRNSWLPTLPEVELGFRLVPIVLALRSSTRFGEILSDKKLFSLNAKSELQNNLAHLLMAAGLFDFNKNLTLLGERVLRRGPGPMGIIHAYYPYMENHADELLGKDVSRWIERTANIAASQDANAKTFARALESLKNYQDDTGFKYNVFIEHAVGQGEATRQHFDKYGGTNFQYFGADLEDKAIEQTRRQQLLGRLPENMQMISGADIGKPEILTDAITRAGFSTHGSVMVVGNGFHEIRGQTDEKMVEVFKKYHAAGILIIFTEETALSNDELLKSAWNTYHAGFRYTHEISGQGLRRFNQSGLGSRMLSWKECAEAGGYQVLMKYTSRGRAIFPEEISDSNPPITANYFCVP